MSWRARASDLTWRSWDESEYLVYDAASGDTHVLDQIAGQSLRQLEMAALSCEQLTSRVGQILNLDEVALLPQIARLLTRLDQLGLIEPAS